MRVSRLPWGKQCLKDDAQGRYGDLLDTGAPAHRRVCVGGAVNRRRSDSVRTRSKRTQPHLEVRTIEHRIPQGIPVRILRRKSTPPRHGTRERLSSGAGRGGGFPCVFVQMKSHVMPSCRQN